MLGRLGSQARSFGAHLRTNAVRILVDLVIVTSWMIVSTELLHTLEVVRWVQYVVLFAGVLVYAMLTPPWGSSATDE